MSNSSTVQIPSEAPVSQVVTSKNSKGNKFFKTALILLGVTLVIVLAEAAYLIFSKRGNLLSRKSGEAQIIQKSPVSTIPAYPTQLISQTPKTFDVEKASRFIQNLGTESLNGFLTKATIGFTINGTVVRTDFVDREIDNLKYIYLIEIINPAGQNIKLLYTAEEMQKGKVFLIAASDRKEISFTEIQPGDILVASENVNLLDSSPHSNLELEIRR